MQPPGVEEDMELAPAFEAKEYKEAGKLRGRVALITGGDSGIGRAVAYLYAREGADVALTYLPEEEVDAQRVVSMIEDLGQRAMALQFDVRSPSECQRVVQETIDTFGSLNILVNNAAFQNHIDQFEDLTPEQWERTIQTNISGYFYMTQAALPYLDEGSVILNTGSITGLEGSGRLVDYSTTKGAIHAFTKALAQNLLRRGIRVNCIAPGPVWTPLNDAERKAEEVEEFGKGTGYGRPAQPEEIAPAYVFLASQDSSYITGEVLTLLGGDTRAG